MPWVAQISANLLKDEELVDLIARFFFRGIYFPQMSRRAWLKLIADNRRVIYKLVKEAAVNWRKARRKSADLSVEARAS